MHKDLKQSIRKHIAGATVAHKSPFENLVTPENQVALDKNFIDKFVIPLYMAIGTSEQNNDKLILQLKHILPEVNSKIIGMLLGDFNWRTRSVGASFATLKNLTEFQDQIGKLFLKSEVCYAGENYCLALASFNNQSSINYLNRYLDYYLTQKDLWFDQGQAMAALAHLDKLNGTNELNNHLSRWSEFISNKPNWNLDRSIEHFEESMNKLEELKTLIN